MNNDLISREALKDEVRKHAEYYADRTEEDRYNVGYTECACEILDFIDNAQAVEQNWRFYYDHGYKQAERDLKRPQGKWGKWVISEIRCPNCLEYFDADCYSTEELKKCPYCGQPMMKEDAE